MDTLIHKSVYSELPDCFNITNFLLQRNISRLQEVFLYTENATYTFDSIKNLIIGFGYYCRDLSISRKDRIALIVPDSVEFFSCFLGSIAMGAVPVIINEMLSCEDIAYSIQNCGAKVVITTKKLKSQLQKSFLSKIHYEIIDNGSLFNKIKGFKGEFSFVRTCKDDPAFWAYTSGSSNKPKGVIHRHYSPVVACENYGIRTLKLTCRDKILSGPPLAFTYGLGAALYMPMYVGAKVVLSKKKDAFSLVNKLNTFEPSVFFGVPNHFSTILAIRNICCLKNSYLRICISAGEKLPSVIWNKWLKYSGVPICEGVGTTESTHIFISNDINRCKANRVGKPVYGYKVDLVDNAGAPVSQGKIGSLRVSGEGFMLGYWNRPEETKKTLSNNNVLNINDLYKKDKDGYYYFVGRRDNLLKFRGFWIIPSEIEDIVLAVEGISQASIVPIRHTSLDGVDELCLCIEVKNNQLSSGIKKNILSILSDKLPKYKIPRHVVAIEEFPLLATEKINKKALMKIISDKVYGCEV